MVLSTKFSTAVISQRDQEISSQRDPGPYCITVYCEIKHILLDQWILLVVIFDTGSGSF